jgi:MFS family permease
MRNEYSGDDSTAMGIHQSVYAIGMFSGPWIGGIVADALGIRAMFAIVGAFTLVAPAALISLYRAASVAAGVEARDESGPLARSVRR